MKRYLALIPIVLALVSLGAYKAYADIYGSGMVGYWNLDSNSISGTSVSDLSGNGNTGTMVGGPTAVTGKIGQALSFNGSGQYISIPNSSSLQVGATFTASVWVLPAAFNNRYPVFSNRNPNINGAWQIEVGTASGAGINRVAVAGSGAWIYESNDNAIKSNQWTNITYVRTSNANAGALYVNGALVAPRQTTAYNITNNTNASEIGAGYTGQVPYIGSIDDVRLYNRALSAAEVQTLYYQGVSQHGGGGF